jgi:hypothetical protein
MGNDLTLQIITASVIKIETKNIEFRRNRLFDSRGRSIRLLSQFATKNNIMLIDNPKGPLPKILLNLVGCLLIRDSPTSTRYYKKWGPSPMS